MQTTGERHMIPMQLKLHVLAPQFIGLIHEGILDKNIFLLDDLELIGVGGLYDLVPKHNLILRVGIGGVFRHHVHEQLLDVPMEGGSEVGVDVEGEEGTIDATVRLERSERVETELVDYGFGSVGVSVLAQRSENGKTKECGQAEEDHGV